MTPSDPLSPSPSLWDQANAELENRQSRTLHQQKTAAQQQEQQSQAREWGVADYAFDWGVKAPVAAVSNLAETTIGIGAAVGNLGISAYEKATGNEIEMEFSTPDFNKGFEPESTVGSLLGVGGEFVVGTLLTGGALKGLGLAANAYNKAGTVAKLADGTIKGSRLAYQVGSGTGYAAARSLTRQEHEQNLSNLIQNTPLANPINAYLSSSPDDSTAERVFKVAVEDVALTGALWWASGLIPWVKGMRAADELAKTAGPDIAKELADIGLRETQEVLQKMLDGGVAHVTTDRSFMAALKATEKFTDEQLTAELIKARGFAASNGTPLSVSLVDALNIRGVTFEKESQLLEALYQGGKGTPKPTPEPSAVKYPKRYANLTEEGKKLAEVPDNVPADPRLETLKRGEGLTFNETRAPEYRVTDDVAARKQAKELIAVAKANPYGFSVEPGTWKSKYHPPESKTLNDAADYVSAIPHRELVIPGGPNALKDPAVLQRVESWLKDADVALKDKDYFIGGWYRSEPKDGKVRAYVIDVVTNVKGKAQSHEFGRLADQDALFHPNSYDELFLKNSYSPEEGFGILTKYTDATGNVRVYHRTNARDGRPSLTVDPKKFGQNSFTRNDAKASSIPRAFYNVDLNHTEGQLSGSPLYTAYVPSNKIYDIVNDPQGILKDVKGSFDGRIDVDELLRRTRTALDESGNRSFMGVAYSNGGDEANPRIVVALFDKLKTQIADGASTLRQGGDDVRGAVTFNTEGDAILHIYSNSDVSTLVHEMGHIYRRNLSGPAQEMALRLFSKSGVWDRASEEAFAEAYENWSASGKAPLPEMEPIFTKFKTWMGEVYHGVANSPLGHNVAPEVHAFFNKMGVSSESLFSSETNKTILAAVDHAVATGKPFSELVEEVGRNLSKTDLGDDPKRAINELAQIISERVNILRSGNSTGKMTLDEIKSNADTIVKGMSEELGFPGDKLAVKLRELAGNMDDVESSLVAGRIYFNALSESVVSASAHAAKTGTDEARYQALVLIDKWKDLYASITSIQTRAARTTTAGRIQTGSFDAVAFRDALNSMGGREGMDKVLNDLLLAKGRTGVRQVINNSNRWLDVLLEYRVNALLSSPRTQIVNGISNTIKALIMPAEYMLGGVMRADTESFRKGIGLYMGLASSFRDALSMAKKSFQSTESILTADNRFNGLRRGIRSERFNLSGTNYGKAIDAVGAVTRTPSRFLLSTDEFFKQISYRASVTGYYTEEGLKRGLKGEQLAAHIADGMQSSFDKAGRGLHSEALQYAKEATFQQDLEGFSQSISQFLGKHPTMRLILPFIKTPANLFKDVWTHTPILGAGVRQWREDFAAGGVKRSKALGQWALGGALYGSAAMLALEGKITGRGPADRNKKDLKSAAGWQAYSLVTKGENGEDVYTSYARLDPFGMILGLVADFAEASGEMSDDQRDQVVTAIGIAGLRNLTSKTYLTGLIDFLDAVSEPDHKLENFLKRFAGSFVPTGINHTTSDDGHMREARTLLDGVRAKLPGYSETLPPRRNIFGEPIKIPTGWGPDAVSPFAQTRQLDDAAKQELARLRHGFSKPSYKIGALDLRDFKDAKGQDAYDRLQELIGTIKLEGKTLAETMNSVVKRKDYQALPQYDDGAVPEGRILVINRVLEAYRRAAKATLTGENPVLAQALVTQKVQSAKSRTQQVLEFADAQ